MGTIRGIIVIKPQQIAAITNSSNNWQNGIRLFILPAAVAVQVSVLDEVPLDGH